MGWGSFLETMRKAEKQRKKKEKRVMRGCYPDNRKQRETKGVLMALYRRCGAFTSAKRLCLLPTLIALNNDNMDYNDQVLVKFMFK